jgi:GAF domain-containing protein
MTPVVTTEAERLRALAEYNVLDSAPEEAFDDLTTLAALICGVEMALVTIVDEHRQWFKARRGLDLQETPREHSFCAHAIREPQNLMIVSDATRDERFARNPYVTGRPNIRFYAGAPLLSHQGAALGTLCVLHHTPRQLTPEQLHALRILGRQASYLLELRRVTAALAKSAKAAASTTAIKR